MREAERAIPSRLVRGPRRLCEGTLPQVKSMIHVGLAFAIVAFGIAASGCTNEGQAYDAGYAPYGTPLPDSGGSGGSGGGEMGETCGNTPTQTEPCACSSCAPDSGCVENCGCSPGPDGTIERLCTVDCPPAACPPLSVMDLDYYCPTMGQTCSYDQQDASCPMTCTCGPAGASMYCNCSGEGTYVCGNIWTCSTAKCDGGGADAAQDGATDAPGDVNSN
jgi:hypothetical protein